MKPLDKLPGAFALPAGYFYRVTKNSAGGVVQVRKKTKIGSRLIVEAYVLDAREGVIQIQSAAERAHTKFLDVTRNVLNNYYGDYSGQA